MLIKWQCNGCGKMYDFRSDAASCCPDVNRVEIEEPQDRTAEQRNEAVNAGQICPSCDGKGHLEWQSLVIDCRDCNGTGHI